MAHFNVQGRIVGPSGGIVGVEGAEADTFLAIMEPSGNFVVLNNVAASDVEGNFTNNFDLPFGSNIFGIFVAAFDPKTQRAGSGYSAGVGIHWVDGQVDDFGSVVISSPV